MYHNTVHRPATPSVIATEATNLYTSQRQNTTTDRAKTNHRRLLHTHIHTHTHTHTHIHTYTHTHRERERERERERSAGLRFGPSTVYCACSLPITTALSIPFALRRVGCRTTGKPPPTRELVRSATRAESSRKTDPSYAAVYRYKCRHTPTTRRRTSCLIT